MSFGEKQNGLRQRIGAVGEMLRCLVISVMLIACSAMVTSAQQRTSRVGKQAALSVLGPFVEEASRHARAEDRHNADAPVILSLERIISAVQQSIGVSLGPDEVKAAIETPYTDGFSADVITCAPSHGPCRISSGAVVLQMRGVYRWQGNLVVVAAYFWPESSTPGQERVGLVQAEFWFRRDGARWRPVRFIELARDTMPDRGS